MSRYAVGIGARRGVRPDAVVALVGGVLAAHGIDPAAAVFATVADRAGEPGLRDAVRRIAADPARPVELLGWAPGDLAREDVPHPSGRVAATLGTPSVAEAAALRTARSLPGAAGADLTVPKTVGDGVTVAVAVAR